MMHFSKTLKLHLSIAAVTGALVFSAGSAKGNIIITPTFDSSITTDVNAAPIESVINQAIATYESHLTDNINVTIDFKEMTSGLGQSNWYYYNIPYSTYIANLTADKTTTSDNTALAHLPTGSNNPVNGGTTINVKTANLHAIGLSGYSSGLAGGYDGIVSLNTHITDVGSPASSGQYSLISTAEHEIDEVLGLGSALAGGLVNGAPMPEDLFRYTSTGSRSFTTLGDNAYFSIDGTTDLARFNQDSSGDYGDWWSGNGTGNAGPNPPTEVQDAFLYPNRTPTLGVEYTALDVVGYNITNVPEPSSLAIVAGVAVCAASRRRNQN